MNKYEELANEVIDIVCDTFLELYPDIPVRKDFLDESPDAHHIYGTTYYNLEDTIAHKIEKFCKEKRV